MTNYLENAFKKLSSLDEEVFDFDKKGFAELKDFMDDDYEDERVDVIDTEAQDEEELKDDYIGKVILDCQVCHSKVFEDVDEIELNDDKTIANEGKECPYCYATDGFKVIGEVKEFCDHCNDEHEEGEHEEHEEEEHEEDEEDEVEVEVKEKEETDESLNKKKITESSKRDDIDAEADDRKERLKKYLQRKRDDIDSGRDYRLKRGITRRDESCKKKPCKEDLSYGELVAIEDEWQKFKKKKGSNDADTAWEFIETECKGVYDTDEEKDAIFAYIGSLEESKGKRRDCKKKVCNEDADVTDQVVIKLSEPGFIGKKHELQDKGYKVISTGNGMIIMAKPKPLGKKEECKESIESISVDTGDQIIDVTAKDKEEEIVADAEKEEEVVAPVDDETKDEIIADDEEGSVDVSVDDFSEEEFDEIGERYFKEAYKNVKGYKTTNVFQNGNRLKVEGIVTFTSGKSKKTNFVFEAKEISRKGKAK